MLTGAAGDMKHRSGQALISYLRHDEQTGNQVLETAVLHARMICLQARVLRTGMLLTPPTLERKLNRNAPDICLPT